MTDTVHTFVFDWDEKAVRCVKCGLVTADSRYAESSCDNSLAIKRAFQHLEDPEAYAAAITRARQLTDADTAAAAEQFIAEVTAAIAKTGLEAHVTQFIDADVPMLRWRITVLTPRGSIPIELDDPADWRDVLSEMGIL